MKYSWSFRTCGLLFKNMPNCHKFEGDVDIYELPSWSTLKWNIKIPWTSYNQIKKMRGKFISLFGLWMKSSKEIKETTWSLTIDDIVHHQQKLEQGTKTPNLTSRSITSDKKLFHVWQSLGVNSSSPGDNLV